MEIEMTIILFIALAVFLVYVAYKNNWEWKTTIAAIGSGSMAAWEAFKGVL